MFFFFFLVSFLLQILHCQALKIVNFNSCKLIKKLPDLSMVPNLEKLNLCFCKKLKKVHYSVGRLKKLKEWYLYDCVKLETLPRHLKMNSLAQFSLKGCSSLKKLPKFSKKMKSLFSLVLSGSDIRKLPVSLKHLISLQYLSFGNDLVVLHVPSIIYNCMHFVEILGLPPPNIPCLGVGRDMLMGSQPQPSSRMSLGIEDEEEDTENNRETKAKR